MHEVDVVATPKKIFFDGKEIPWYVSAEEGIHYDKNPDDIGRLTMTFLTDNFRFGRFDYEEQFDVWLADYDERWLFIEANIGDDDWWEHMKMNCVMEEYGVRTG